MKSLRLKEKHKAGVIAPKLDTSIKLPTIHKEGSEQRRPSRNIIGACEADTRDSRDMASVRDAPEHRDSGWSVIEGSEHTAPSLAINCQLRWAWLSIEK